MRSTAFFAVAVLFAFPRLTIAQPVTAPPLGPAPAAAAPARDTPRAATTGTAVIRGRITAADTGRPLRRASIRLTSPTLGREGKTASTNADGRYEIKELPAGRYSLTVTRSGYLSLRYGQR